MTTEQNKQITLSRYIEDFLEEHFGEIPENISVILKPPFLLIYLEEFLLPGEKLFVERQYWNRVLENRDFIMKSLKPDLMAGLQEQAGRNVLDLYTDWNLERRSGLIMAVFEAETAPEELPWPEEVDQEAIREIVQLNSIRTQKKPDNQYFYWLTPDVLLIERVGVMVDIEKQLIQNGVKEELRLAKRPMEQRIVKLFNLETLLKAQVKELFVDWNFEKDKSFMVLMLQ